MVKVGQHGPGTTRDGLFRTTSSASVPSSESLPAGWREEGTGSCCLVGTVPVGMFSQLVKVLNAT